MLVAAILIVAFMVALKDGRVLRNTGLTGGCHAVATPAGERRRAGTRATAASSQGAPDLSRQGCKSAKVVGQDEYWRCPAAIESSNQTPSG